MPEMVCPNGHGATDWERESPDETPLCPECRAELVPATAIIDVHKQTRVVWLAYEVAVLDVEAALPDMAVNPAAGEGPLSCVVLTSPDRLERLIILTGDDQARVLIGGLVERHTPQPFGSSIVIPDTIPPDLHV